MAEVQAQDQIMKELEETREKLLRALADFDNFRKRTQAERGELAAFAIEGVVQSLLPILDNFERAVSSADSTVPENFLKGVALIKRQLEDLLTKFGIEPIDALGKTFDPHEHEVVLKKKIEGAQEGEILEVVQPGYRLNSRVIRPAMVIIATHETKGG